MPPWVYPTSFAMKMGLSTTGFRETLVNEDHVQACFPLSEIASERAHDISGRNNHGTFVGTGFTRGVSLDIPEGVLGLTGDGNGYIEIPHANGLSLENGDIDEYWLIKTSNNDATLRAIGQKQETDATGDGWHVAHQSGAIRFFLRVSGVTIFDFARGSVSDNALHLIHCNYLSGLGEARILIDGVQSGATVSTTTTEPAVTTADMRLFAFNDGVAGDGNGFIGTLAYFTIGREGNLTLSTSLQNTRSWTATQDDVHSGTPIQASSGIQGNSVVDNVARTGTMTFAFKNDEKNSAKKIGYYSPGHPNVRAGFRIGDPVQWSIVYGGTTYYPFRGRLKSAKPVPSQYGPRTVLATCVDWMDVAASTSVSALEAQINQRSDLVFGEVVDQAAGRSPSAVSLGVGSSQFPFALDLAQGESETLLTEFARVAASERAYVYIKGDTSQGGTLVYEGRGARQITTALAATFDNNMHGLEVDYSIDRLVNIVRVTVHPRRVDAAATTVLYALEVSQQSQQIVPGQTIVLEGGYRDPSQEAERVGGTDMVTPVAGTDYAFFSNSDGTGGDLTANLSIVSNLGGNSFRIEITNSGSLSGFLRLNASTAFQIRGKGIYHYAPVTVERSDRDSVRRYGPRTVRIEMPYESSIPVAESVADFYLNILGSQRAIPTSLALLGNFSHQHMVYALSLEPGHKIGILETVTGVTTDDPLSTESVGYYINGKTLTWEHGGIIRANFMLAPAAPTGAWVFSQSTFDETTRFGF